MVSATAPRAPQEAKAERAERRVTELQSSLRRSFLDGAAPALGSSQEEFLPQIPPSPVPLAVEPFSVLSPHPLSLLSPSQSLPLSRLDNPNSPILTAELFPPSAHPCGPTAVIH